MFDLMNQVVIITGAAGNLGQVVAREFLANGARVTLVDRAPDRLARLYPELATDSTHYLANSVDLADETAVNAMVTEVLRRFGRIDVLVNTAGGFRSGGPVHKTPLDLYDAMLTTNMRTMLVASRAVIPQMIEQESGRIINISAQRALKGSAGTSAYGLSKAAVLHLTESMAAELKKHQIRVNCVLPNTIDTPENRKAMPKADWSRWTPPEAIADVILFLASEESRAVNGASIPV